MNFTVDSFELLNERVKNKNPVRVALLGAGWFGSGLIQELRHWPGIELRVIFSRNTQRAVQALIDAGIRPQEIVVVQSSAELKEQLRLNHYLVSSDFHLIGDLQAIDVVFDTTGDILCGAQAAMAAFGKGMHFITVSSELDSTIGYILQKKAREAGVIYSNSDGDQPGVLARLIPEVKAYGFEIVVAGNCKGFLDVHKTPQDIMPWVRPGQNPKMITAFTDGTKQALELAALANGFGLKPDCRGMHGVRTTRTTIVEDFLNAISHNGIVDYTLGIDGVNQGAGVFVIGKREGKRVQEDMNYLKKGKGPYYLFFRDQHLCYFEAPRSIVDVMLYKTPTLASGQLTAEVLTVAKKDLKMADSLDGIGGYTIYGLIEDAQVVQEAKLLPIGLAEYAVLKKDVSKDTPLTYSMVDFPVKNLVTQLRREQDALQV